MLTFVALGDSTTEGYGDRMPDGTWRGWAALLADSLPARLHNLARSGALAADVAERQLPTALAHRPDLAAVLVGVNDTLRHPFDVAAVGAAIDRTVGALRSAGAAVLTGCLPDPGRMLRLPAALARPLARRIRAVNALTHAVAARHGALHLHIPHLPSAYDSHMWSVDRLHPGERGHRLLAGGYYDLLRAAGLATGARPRPEPVNAPPTLGASAWWMATRGTRWVVDRSTDLVPYLTWMAAAEWWYGLRGAAHRLDERIQAEIGAALDRLDGPADAGSALERAAF
ncbi:SGNH/GDSL hydrolase family protein [Rhizomonospora bruguierae]|uniref:SGNH/GDSL hydrolase family protein n=1 Tax=Rhizomonospora bruguierae TaxID=1581705 RepID=UPI001BCE13DB|nr:SGNH/GDSL hydrolase family protein [Micromonospora sp. NBRC 107566]